MTVKDVKRLMKNYPTILAVVDLANDWHIECEKHARLLVGFVDIIVKHPDVKCICFKKYHIDGKSCLEIALEEGVGTSTVHRWVTQLEEKIAVAMSSVRGSDEWMDFHFGRFMEIK